MDAVDQSFFDIVHDRRNTSSVKYHLSPCAYPGEVIPMWVADMDFKVAPVIEEALVATARHGIFGYAKPDADYDAQVINWYRRRHGWDIQPQWIHKVPGVLFGLTAAIRALTEPGDRILICQPVYYPFANLIAGNGRQTVVSPLSLVRGRYEIDFTDFEAQIAAHQVKLFVLCSPHNPVGRVWTEDELRKIAQICCKHDVYIVSDEIHGDFVYPGNRHIPIASLGEEIAARTITCTAPTKTFNLAGIQAAQLIISEDVLRRKIRKVCHATGYGSLNAMAISATKAAYAEGEPWLEALLAYLQGNIAILQKLCEDSGGKLKLIAPEGTYLMWLDCRELGIPAEGLEDFFLQKAGVWLENGTVFGQGGEGFVRMNIACPRTILQEALARIRQAINNI